MSNLSDALASLRAAMRWRSRHGKPDVPAIHHAEHDIEAAMKPVPAPTFPAIISARGQSQTGVPMLGEGQCLRYVQGAYGIAPRDPDAINAWRRAGMKHPQIDPMKIPRGYPVFWSGGSSGHGHIAIAAGNGMCWSTDIKRVGFFDFVPIDLIRTQWNLTLLGWTEDLEGAKVVAEKR